MYPGIGLLLGPHGGCGDHIKDIWIEQIDTDYQLHGYCKLRVNACLWGTRQLALGRLICAIHFAAKVAAHR